MSLFILLIILWLFHNNLLMARSSIEWFNSKRRVFASFLNASLLFNFKISHILVFVEFIFEISK